MKKQLLLIATLGAFASASHASTVSINRGLNPGFNIQNNSGTVITTYSILVGSFDVNPVAPAPATLKALLQTAAFNEFGLATAPAGGLLAGSITKNDFTTGPAPTEFNGKNIYVVVMDAATAAASNEFALLTVDTTSPAGTWVFPADVTSALTTTNAPAGLISSFATVLGTEIDNATGPESLRLAAIPEPTTTVLASGLLALGFFRRRR